MMGPAPGRPAGVQDAPHSAVAHRNPGRGVYAPLPRSGPLQRALHPPLAADAMGGVLGDPVRPFMRLRRRFPVAARSLRSFRPLATRSHADADAAAPTRSMQSAPPRLLPGRATTSPAAAVADLRASSMGRPAQSQRQASQRDQPRRLAPSGPALSPAAAMQFVGPPLSSDAASGLGRQASVPAARPGSPAAQPAQRPPGPEVATLPSLPSAPAPTSSASPAAGQPSVSRSAGSPQRRAQVTTTPPATSPAPGALSLSSLPVGPPPGTPAPRRLAQVVEVTPPRNTRTGTPAAGQPSPGGAPPVAQDSSPAQRATSPAGTLPLSPSAARDGVATEPPASAQEAPGAPKAAPGTAEGPTGAQRASGASQPGPGPTQQAAPQPQPRLRRVVTEVRAREPVPSIEAPRSHEPTVPSAPPPPSEPGTTLAVSTPSTASASTAGAGPLAPGPASPEALQRLATMRGRLGLRGASGWQAPDLPNVRVPGAPPAFRLASRGLPTVVGRPDGESSPGSGAPEVGSGAATFPRGGAGLPDLIAPPQGIPIRMAGSAEPSTAPLRAAAPSPTSTPAPGAPSVARARHAPSTSADPSQLPSAASASAPQGRPQRTPAAPTQQATETGTRAPATGDLRPVAGAQAAAGQSEFGDLSRQATGLTSATGVRTSAVPPTGTPQRAMAAGQPNESQPSASQPSASQPDSAVPARVDGPGGAWEGSAGRGAEAAADVRTPVAEATEATGARSIEGGRTPEGAYAAPAGTSMFALRRLTDLAADSALSPRAPLLARSALDASVGSVLGTGAAGLNTSAGAPGIVAPPSGLLLPGAQPASPPVSREAASSTGAQMSDTSPATRPAPADAPSPGVPAPSAEAGPAQRAARGVSTITREAPPVPGAPAQRVTQSAPGSTPAAARHSIEGSPAVPGATGRGTDVASSSAGDPSTAQRNVPGRAAQASSGGGGASAGGAPVSPSTPSAVSSIVSFLNRRRGASEAGGSGRSRTSGQSEAARKVEAGRDSPSTPGAGESHATAAGAAGQQSTSRATQSASWTPPSPAASATRPPAAQRTNVEGGLPALPPASPHAGEGATTQRAAQSPVPPGGAADASGALVAAHAASDFIEPGIGRSVTLPAAVDRPQAESGAQLGAAGGSVGAAGSLPVGPSGLVIAPDAPDDGAADRSASRAISEPAAASAGGPGQATESGERAASAAADTPSAPASTSGQAAVEAAPATGPLAPAARVPADLVARRISRMFGAGTSEGAHYSGGLSPALGAPVFGGGPQVVRPRGATGIDGTSSATSRRAAAKPAAATGTLRTAHRPITRAAQASSAPRAAGHVSPDGLRRRAVDATGTRSRTLGSPEGANHALATGAIGARRPDLPGGRAASLPPVPAPGALPFAARMLAAGTPAGSSVSGGVGGSLARATQQAGSAGVTVGRRSSTVGRSAGGRAAALPMGLDGGDGAGGGWPAAGGSPASARATVGESGTVSRSILGDAGLGASHLAGHGGRGAGRGSRPVPTAHGATGMARAGLAARRVAQAAGRTSGPALGTTARAAREVARRMSSARHAAPTGAATTQGVQTPGDGGSSTSSSSAVATAPAAAGSLSALLATAPPVMVGATAGSGTSPDAPKAPRSASMSPLAIARSAVGTLPVSGVGAMGGVASAAGDVARSAAEEAVSQHVARQTSGGAAAGGAGSTVHYSSAAGSSVLRAVEAGGAPAPAPVDEEAQQEAMLKFATSDEFEERLMEFLEDRLLGEIERRGGRYGGWFA